MLKWAIFSPHPPLLIPEIGKQMLSQVEKTKNSLEQVFAKVHNVDTIIVITPHGFASENAITCYQTDMLNGALTDFSGGCPVIELTVDQDLNEMINQTADNQNIDVNWITKNSLKFSEELLDHGSYVPLYYALKNLTSTPRIVVINPGFVTIDALWQFGEALQSQLADTKKDIGLIISGDLSHRLTQGAPAGYHPEAYKFDQEIKDIIEQGPLSRLKKLSSQLLSTAGECGYRPLILGSGMLDNLNLSDKQVLSYEGPFGVGYLVARLF
ncbi:class III extradiol dioxygenase subunit B-like domain-containing protein [Natranaerobius thermophilus]|uniref:Extradiol ring-cleavage dioxygenase class III protein subunit B n=1 Tax=Natranaerobius thermophilus (strain ATCC BAA-1301 / DSM 18059 / JW/NM-WN-LF) TaxID=457570 RepID=B2A4R4_NATTJ|nr:class III extradiol dioxygenase subunit B-like domain-containing protein [Natranaerobius thermophilus]ACB83836.1 Extradiol ring-cleavage dioxygenase class III protein subunit B [Natranaerobius thermophilus JW/NM-WN-LF]